MPRLTAVGGELRFLREVVKPYKVYLCVAIIGMVVMALLEPVLPWLLKPMVDEAFVARDPQMIVLIPIALIGVFIARGIAFFVAEYGANWVANSVIRDVRQRLFTKIVHLPHAYFDQHPTGRIVSRVTYDVEQIAATIVNVWVTIIRDSVTVLGLVGLICYLNWRFSLFLLLFVPLMWLVFTVLSRRMRGAGVIVQDRIGDVTHVLGEWLAGISTVRIAQMRNRLQRRFDGLVNQIRAQRMKVVIASVLNVSVVQIVIAAAVAIAIYSALRSSMSAGELMAYFGAMAMLFSPMKRLTSINDPLQRGLAAISALIEFFDEHEEKDAGTKSVDDAGVRGELVVDNVTFRYAPDGQKAALSGCTLTVQSGETVALVGPSGGGKSTLVRLLLRLYDPDDGVIRFDGVDLRELPRTFLYSHIAYVEQRAPLFDTSIRANIALVDDDDDIDEQRVAYAVRLARLDELIARLPQGVATVVGERGARLSGGERQRVALARAFYQRAAVYVFDECTSELDVKTERFVQKSISEHCRGKTTIIVAHRLATITAVQKIAVVAEGAVVETGTHEQLLARGGLYAQLRAYATER